jgi:type IV secretory pathway protease TraF
LGNEMPRKEVVRRQHANMRDIFIAITRVSNTSFDGTIYGLFKAVGVLGLGSPAQILERIIENESHIFLVLLMFS